MLTYNEIEKAIIKLNIIRVRKGGKKMNNYSISDDVSKKVYDTYSNSVQKDDIDKVINSINKIKNTFDDVEIPDYEAPKFERLDSIEKSSEDIAGEAENSLADFKNSSLNSIEKDIENQRTSLETNKQSLAETKDNAVATVKSNYASAKREASDDALKRGLARSSIAVSVLDAFSQDEIDALNSIEKEYAGSLNEINFELNALDAQKKKALDDFDIAYAVKLNDKISSLTNDYNKKQQEIIEYNNKIAEKEKDYLDKYNNLVADIQSDNYSNATKKAELYNKYGSKFISTYTKNQIYDVLDNYFANKSNEEIKAVLDDENLKTALGSNYGDVLKRYGV